MAIRPTTIQRAVAALQSAVEALKDAVNALQSTDLTLSRAIFGRWDQDLNKHIPGLQDDFNSLREQVQKLDVQLQFQRRYVFWAIIPLFLVSLRALGVPTDIIGAFLLRILTGGH